MSSISYEWQHELWARHWKLASCASTISKGHACKKDSERCPCQLPGSYFLVNIKTVAGSSGDLWWRQMSSLFYLHNFMLEKADVILLFLTTTFLKPSFCVFKSRSSSRSEITSIFLGAIAHLPQIKTGDNGVTVKMDSNVLIYKINES